MCGRLMIAVLCAAAQAATGGETPWHHSALRYRLRVRRAAPWRGDAPRPIELAVDFPRLLARAGLGAKAHATDLHVVEADTARAVPCAVRGQRGAAAEADRPYLAWMARPRQTPTTNFDVYFNVAENPPAATRPASRALPPENLLANGNFARHRDGQPEAWTVNAPALVRAGTSRPGIGAALTITVDAATPPDATREVHVSQSFDVAPWAGCEMTFACDLLAERAAYGAPVSIRIEQVRKDGSRIAGYAVDPRWTTIELARGQLVRLRQRGRFHPEAAGAKVVLRARCTVRDADTRKVVTGPESHFTIHVARMIVRPGQRWPWPPASEGAFAQGALRDAPRNRGIVLRGLRRVAFNGASEATLTTGKYGPAGETHWGLAAGTLEFWCRPTWSADDGREHVFFYGVSYGHRLHSRLRKRDAAGGNRLEFAIADAGGSMRTVRGAAKLVAGRWHHVAACWDFAAGRQQLFVDGRRIASAGPDTKGWSWSTVAVGGKKKTPGIGISKTDTRSLPMQAFIGGGLRCRPARAADAVLDELRISDVARYASEFTPSRAEFPLDQHTRALWHFEGDVQGTHDGGDRFVRGHLACELPRRRDEVVLEQRNGATVTRRTVALGLRADEKLFDTCRAEARLPVTRPVHPRPDPRFVALVPAEATRDLPEAGRGFNLTVGGDWEPWMRSITFRHARPAAKATPLPRWRANDNPVPFSAADLAATVAPNEPDDARRAFEAFRYALETTNYYDAHFCETLPTRHRSRIAYTFTKALNIYAFDQCGPLNHTLRKLFLAVGISSNNASGTHHQFQQAFYGDRWRLFDLSPRLYWLRRDNRTVAGRRDFEEDLYLKIRQGSGVCSALRGRPGHATFGSAERPHRMDLDLQPGERLGVCWHNEGRWFEITGDRKPIPLAKIPPLFGNGSIVYEPPAGQARAVYRCRCPYILSDARVTGTLSPGKPGDVRLMLSFDRGKRWLEAWRAGDGPGEIAADLRDHVTGRYEYWLKLTGAPARVRNLRVRTTFVVSPLSLPGWLKRGANRIRFVGGRPTGTVRTRCRWIERHRTDLGVSLSGLGFYLDGNRSHRSVVVARPGGRFSLTVAITGRGDAGEVSIRGLPAGWLDGPDRRRVGKVDPSRPARVVFSGTARGKRGDVRGFELALSGGSGPAGRRRWGQILLADAPLVREAEAADATEGKVAPANVPGASGRRVMAFDGSGRLTFETPASPGGTYALWLLARWRPDADVQMRLTVDAAKPRTLRPVARIGFNDWTDPTRAHTKMFAHYGEQYGYRSWYRVPDVRLAAGKHRVRLGATRGARIDAVVLLPAGAAVDRAAMNLFQNANYAPWLSPW